MIVQKTVRKKIDRLLSFLTSLMGFFTEEDIRNAKAYKYNGTDVSIILYLFYRKFWDWLINFFPTWLAPNLITLLGFLFEIVSFAVSFYLSDGLQNELPWYVCIFNGICLLIYQTLDNLDGRQARRTGSSSPLGQFFDHGCDAITGVSELIKVAASFSFGRSKETFYFVFLMSVGFFLTSWEEYVTHAFYLGPINGPDEGLFVLAGLQIAVGIFPQLRKYSNESFVSIVFFTAMIVTIGTIIVHVIKKVINDTDALKRGLFSLIPPVISISIFMGIVLTHSNAFEDIYFTMSACYVLQYQSQCLIVSYLTKRPPSKLIDTPIIICWAGAGAALLIKEVYEIQYFWLIYCGVIVSFMIIFDVRVVLGFCKGLGIHAFSIKKKTA